MKFSTQTPFEERDPVQKELDYLFPYFINVSPPFAGIKPFMLITKKKGTTTYELTSHKLKDLFLSPSPLNTKITRTSIGKLPESSYLDKGDGLPYLQSLLEAMGADDAGKMVKPLKIYEGLILTFRSVRKETLAVSDAELNTWVSKQKPNPNNKLIKAIKNGDDVYLAYVVANNSNVQVDLFAPGEDEIENSSGSVKVKVGSKIQFSSRKRPTLAIVLRRIVDENGDIIIKDPGKGKKNMPTG